MKQVFWGEVLGKKTHMKHTNMLVVFLADGKPEGSDSGLGGSDELDTEHTTPLIVL